MQKAIFGVFGNSFPSEFPDTLNKMANPLDHFGDSKSFFTHDSIGLGAKQIQKGKPYSVGHITLVAYARLDNKEELLRNITPTKKEQARDISTDEIIMLAYLKWGQRCPEHLLGDFVFSLWDAQKKLLFCARDHMGIRPFYYSLANNLFSFSSTLESLLALDYIPKRINEERVTDYLTSVCLNNTTTFYTDILRLPPAHSLTISENSFEIEKYWEYQFTGEISYSTDDEYAEAFKDLFMQAVGSRADSRNMAITMSGGLDSTSVACAAEYINRQSHSDPLNIYSGVFNKYTECDEREYIKNTLKHGNFSWKSLAADDLDPFASLFEIAAVQHEPWFAPHLFMTWDLLKCMQHSGVDLLLDGHDGDTVVSHGYGYFNELIYNFSILTLLKETLLSRATLTPSGQKRILKLLYSKKIHPKIIKIIPSSILSNNKKKSVASSTNSYPTLANFLNKSFEGRPEIKKRLVCAENSQRSSRLERTSHFNKVFHPIQPFALEVLERTAAAFSIEYRCPFWDKRLVEFCLSLPARQKFHNGWPRSILRRAMNNIIPQKVQWRKDKTDFTANLINITDLIYKDTNSELLSQCRQDLDKWIDFDKLITYYRAHPDQKNFAMFDTWKILTLHAWLHTRSFQLD